MKKNLKLLFLYSLSLCLFMAGCTGGKISNPTPLPTATVAPTATPDNNSQTPLMGDFKAMWVSQYDLTSVYTNNGSQRSKTDFTKKITAAIENIKKLGFNTIILQVRPNADSMYPSEYYPMSEYVVGDYGKDASYDPVEIIVSTAHNLDLDIHAWINPMRAMSADDIKKVGDEYKIKQWYKDRTTCGEYIVNVDGRYYLNPAYEEVRNLIIDGAVEAMTKYGFDGLHMDDYFYPTKDPGFDTISYKEYLSDGGALNLEDFRRHSLNLLVSGLYSAVKSINNSLLFGISPAGVINTVYNSQYADVYEWCSKDGYIDYICPQVYFGMEHQNYDFVSVCNTFRDIIKTPSVKLVIGMTFGKALSGVDNYAGSGKYEWQKYDDILSRCLSYTEDLEFCTGISVFCYQYFYQPLTGEKVSGTADEVDNFLPVLGNISWNNTEG